MNNNEKPSLKSKGMSVAIVICFVVVVSVVGPLYTTAIIEEQREVSLQKTTPLQKRPEQPIPMILFCRRPKKIHPQKMNQRQVRMRAQRQRHRQRHRQNKFILMRTVHLHGRQVEV